MVGHQGYATTVGDIRYHTRRSENLSLRGVAQGTNTNQAVVSYNVGLPTRATSISDIKGLHHCYTESTEVGDCCVQVCILLYSLNVHRPRVLYIIYSI